MYSTITAKIRKEAPEGVYLYILIPGAKAIDITRYAKTNGMLNGEIRIDDNRFISANQRKKIYATVADISDYTGYMPEELKEIMKYRYIASTGERYFSLSKCNMTTARLFINYILDFALEWQIPLYDNLIDRTDDINAAIYSSLKHRRCVICGRDGEVHHWDAIGMGRNRVKVDDSYMRKICLCRKHHTEAHQMGRDSFGRKYHVYGIVFRE